MESLDTLVRFVERFPQRTGSNLNYVFIGGTAVRLLQEAYAERTGNETIPPRPISDFDILVLNGKRYPVQSCTPENVFSTLFPSA